MNERIHGLLCSIGITENYIGFYQTAQAIEIAVNDSRSLLLVTKWIYSDIAKEYKISWKTVERNIRTVISVAWRCSQHELERLAGRSLTRKPTPAQFIAILSQCLRAPN